MLNNIKSNFIFKNIFKNVDNTRKLKIIKYNKILINKLGVTLKDYEIYFLLKEFTKKYHLNLRGVDVIDVDLMDFHVGNEELNDLCKIEFKELEKLLLSSNNISDIKMLENANFHKLKKLSLSNNKIKDINIFEKVDFKELTILDLRYNKIKDIKVFERTKFIKLEELFLSNNLKKLNLIN